MSVVQTVFLFFVCLSVCVCVSVQICLCFCIHTANVHEDVVKTLCHPAEECCFLKEDPASYFKKYHVRLLQNRFLLQGTETTLCRIAGGAGISRTITP